MSTIGTIKNTPGLRKVPQEKGPYRHYMLKEIFEQPAALADTLYGRVNNHRVLPQSLGPRAVELLDRAEHIHIIACGTSYHAGCVAKYWIESLAGVPCQVEIASEYRYRQAVVPENTLASLSYPSDSNRDVYLPYNYGSQPHTNLTIGGDTI